MRGTKWLISSANPGQAIGRYEPQQEAILAELLKGASVFWDVGAHVGWYSLLANRLMPNQGQIVCFEPNPSNFGYVKMHIERNRVKRIYALDAALSDRSGTAIFSGTNQTGGLTESGSKNGFTVNTISADEFISKHNSIPDLIKMDVEGAEDRVLAGATNLLSQHKPTILLSTHGWKKRDTCRSVLESYGYSMTSIVSNEEEGDYVFLAQALNKS